jgi:hypothetical protein
MSETNLSPMVAVLLFLPRMKYKRRGSRRCETLSITEPEAEKYQPFLYKSQAMIIDPPKDGFKSVVSLIDLCT